MISNKNVLWLSEIDKIDEPFVGASGVNLGLLSSAGAPVPKTFFITPHAFEAFCYEAKITKPIELLLSEVNLDNIHQIEHISTQIRSLIQNAIFPTGLSHEIISAYHHLEQQEMGLSKRIVHALRNRETAVNISSGFGRSRLEYPNLQGESNLLVSIKSAWQQSFSQYSLHNNFGHSITSHVSPISIQLAIPTKTTALVWTQTKDKNGLIKILAIHGLGELLQNNKITPDLYELDRNFHHLVLEQIANQKIALIPLRGGGTSISNISSRVGKSRKLSLSQLIILSKYAQKIQQHLYFPQICEFSVSKEKIYLLACKPSEEVIVSSIQQPTTSVNERIELINQKNSSAEVPSQIAKSHRQWEEFVSGQSGSKGLKIGHAKNIDHPRDLNKINFGDILIITKFDSHHLSAISKAGAVVTRSGNLHDNFSSIIRRKGIPHVQINSTLSLQIKDNQLLMVSGTEGKIFKAS